MSKSSSQPVVFEPEYIERMTDLFERRIVFNQTLGLKLTSLGPSVATASIEMRSALVGHDAYHRIHGGVISASLDGLGGIAALAAVGARHMDEPPARRMERFAKLGTIDLRVDYLRPGIGERFTLRAEVLRVGSRVASVRMEFMGEDGKLLSTGAAAYMVS